MSETSLRAVRASKWYGGVTALTDVSFELTPGVWGLLGPNGSGKTTLMRLIAGLTKPSLGEIRIDGRAPFANPEVLARIGLCPEADALYDDQSAIDFVTAMAELSGMRRGEARERANASLDDFGLGEAMHRPMGGYSRGMRQRAKLAQSVVHEPDVLLLDEALTGTDPLSRHVILEQVQKRADRGAVVLFSTHVLHEVEALTDRVMLIARGQVVAQGRIREIRDLLDEHPHHVRIECDRPRDLGAAVLAASPAVTSLVVDDTSVELLTKRPDETYDVVRDAALDGGFEVRSLTSPDASLEALFHYLVDKSARIAGTGSDAAQGASKPSAPRSPGSAP